MSVDEKMTALADAIREKANASGKMTIDEMTVYVRGISVGDGDATVQTNKSATITSASGTISPDSGYDSMSVVKYDLDSASKANLKSANIKQGVKILGVTGSYDPPIPSISETIPTFSANGTYMASADGFDGYKGVKVDIDIPQISETVPTFKTNGTYYAKYDGFDGYAAVTVDVPAPTIMGATKEITENGWYDALDDGVAGYSNVRVNIPKDARLQGKTVYSNGIVRPDNGYDGFEYVDVAIPTQVKTIKANGTYEADEDGYFSKVVVNVPSGGGSAVETVAVTINDEWNLHNTVKVSYTGVDDNGNPVSKSVNVVHTDWWGSIDVVKGTDIVIENTDKDTYTIGYDYHNGFVSVDFAGDQVLICRVGNVACEITPSQIEKSGGGGSAIETCQLIIASNGGYGEQTLIPYIDENGQIQYYGGYEMLWGTQQFNVPKNSVVLINPSSCHLSVIEGRDNFINMNEEGETSFSSTEYMHFYRITGDVELSIDSM